jgi:hypothetical protein
MAEGKKSFILYCDLLEVAKELDDKSRGELFLHILEYVNDIDPEPPNQLIKMLFIPIKQSLKRDLAKYESIRERNKSNGLKGGRPKKPKKPTGLSGNPKKPKKADIDNDTVIDTVNDIDRNIPAYDDFLKYAVTKKPKLNPDVLKLKYDSWIENDWRDGNDKPIKNWKTKVLNTLPYIEETTKRVNTNPTLNSIFTDR